MLVAEKGLTLFDRQVFLGRDVVLSLVLFSPRICSLSRELVRLMIKYDLDIFTSGHNLDHVVDYYSQLGGTNRNLEELRGMLDEIFSPWYLTQDSLRRFFSIQEEFIDVELAVDIASMYEVGLKTLITDKKFHVYPDTIRVISVNQAIETLKVAGVLKQLNERRQFFAKKLSIVCSLERILEQDSRERLHREEEEIQRLVASVQKDKKQTRVFADKSSGNNRAIENYSYYSPRSNRFAAMRRLSNQHYFLHQF